MFHWRQVYIWVLFVVWYLIWSYLVLSYLGWFCILLSFVSTLLSLHSWHPFAIAVGCGNFVANLPLHSYCLGFGTALSWLCWWAATSLLCGALNGSFVADWNSHSVRECCCELLWLEKSVQEGHRLFACGVRSKSLFETFRRGRWWSVVASASKDRKTRPKQ